jgi:hypothetical protein
LTLGWGGDWSRHDAAQSYRKFALGWKGEEANL